MNPSQHTQKYYILRYCCKQLTKVKTLVIPISIILIIEQIGCNIPIISVKSHFLSITFENNRMLLSIRSPVFEASKPEYMSSQKKIHIISVNYFIINISRFQL